MIWRSPGVPSLLVTYGVSNDLFFSGHTALAVYGAIELGRWGGTAWAIIGAILAVFEATTVLVLRAHYTLDVFTGAVTAFAAAVVADRLAPGVDAALVAVWNSLFGG
jgi:membrane-associated phospholipid phosphatase